jgi:alkaline phosphatase D
MFFRLFSCFWLFFSMTATGVCSGPYLTNGLKIGEVDSESAIIWTRLSEVPLDEYPPYEKAAPGCEGEVRLTWWPKEIGDQKQQSAWETVDPAKDFTHQFCLRDLTPGSTYSVVCEARPKGEDRLTSRVEGEFKTAPDATSTDPVRLAVVTCQSIRSTDSEENGFETYRVMQDWKPDFFVHTGDIVYYDKEPLCTNVAEARNKWNRMYQFGYVRDFHNQVASYFMKDDHDTLKNDCWAGQTFRDLTFEEGLAIFREQVPMGKKTYRTRRWGKDLQIWMTENRDFRSSNRLPDGPEKTIYGEIQKRWLFDSIQKSDATFKLLISPGAVVGPDKKGKSDNHANLAFGHEGRELRDFIAGEGNVVVVNGDRHWQYHSIDPETGIHEFGCGPINDLHMYGGNCGYQEEFHQYFAAKGGFLGITVSREDGQPVIRFAHWGVDPEDPAGEKWKPLNEQSFTIEQLRKSIRAKR